LIHSLLSGKYLYEILVEVDFVNWTWLVCDEEAYIIENNELGKPLFTTKWITDGKTLYHYLSKQDYYLIFADLKAFPYREIVEEIEDYDSFLTSACTFVLLVVDSSYVTIYSKDQETILKLFEKMNAAGYENVEIITDVNDARTTMVVR